MYNQAIYILRGGSSGPPGSKIWELGSGTLSAQTIGTGCDASGDYSIAENESTTASGEASLSHGLVTDATGDFSEAGGELSIASGLCSYARGLSCVALADFSEATGLGAVAYLYGSKVLALAAEAQGKSQKMEMMMRTATSNGTPQEFFLDYGLGSSVLDPALSGFDLLVWDFEIRATGLHVSTGDVINISQKGTFKYITGSGTLFSPVLTGIMEGDSGASTWNILVDVDPGGTYLRIRAQGQAGKNINWELTVSINQNAN